VKARIETENREFAYRFFVTENLRNIPQNKYYNMDLLEFYEEIKKPHDTRSGDEIALDVIENLGLKLR
jgi:hypothetical protein